MKSFLDLVRTRFSLRSYQDRPVDRAAIIRCLEAARLAPSACNAQPWHFTVADEPALVHSLAAVARLPGTRLNGFVSQSPVIVAVTGEAPNGTSRIGSLLKGKPMHLIDIGIAAEHFCLQAADEGLGTCLLGWYDEKAAKKLLGIPRGKRLYLLITLGHPATADIPAKQRKALDDVSSWNGYAQTVPEPPES